MMLKVAGLMLIVIAALAIFGRLRVKMPGPKRPPALTEVKNCKSCRRPLIGKTPCPCRTGGQA